MERISHIHGFLIVPLAHVDTAQLELAGRRVWRQRVLVGEDVLGGLKEAGRFFPLALVIAYIPRARAMVEGPHRWMLLRGPSREKRRLLDFRVTLRNPAQYPWAMPGRNGVGW